jgi:hypothetical protein
MMLHDNYRNFENSISRFVPTVEEILFFQIVDNLFLFRSVYFKNAPSLMFIA